MTQMINEVSKLNGKLSWLYASIIVIEKQGRVILFASILCTLFPKLLFGQATKEDIERILTVGKKTWRWTKDSVWLSSGCKGRYLIFTQSPKEVNEIYCNEHTKRRDTTRVRWTLFSDKKYSWLLSIGDSVYKLILKETPHKIALILRTRRTDYDVEDTTTDRIYEYIKPDDNEQRKKNK